MAGEFDEYEPGFDPSIYGADAWIQDYLDSLNINPRVEYFVNEQGQRQTLGENPSFTDVLKAFFAGTSSFGKVGSTLGTLGVAALANKLFGGGGGSGFAGYKGSIPTYTATRDVKPIPTTVANPQAGISGQPATIPRRPGSGGIEYFSPMVYTKVQQAGSDTTTGGAGNDTTTGGSGNDTTPSGADTIGGASGGIVSNLGGYSDGGQLLRGPGDGVSDSIPARIGRQPARLADGEFVIPARIVSELGNGSTEAGAKKLYDMMERIKRERKKAKTIASDTKADRFLPR